MPSSRPGPTPERPARPGRSRAQILNKVQQLIHDRVMFAPVMEPAFLNGGGRVGHHALGSIGNFPYAAPYEDLTLEAK